jgi:hypothetical protein
LPDRSTPARTSAAAVCLPNGQADVLAVMDCSWSD